MPKTSKEWKFVSLQIVAGGGSIPTATLVLEQAGEKLREAAQGSSLFSAVKDVFLRIVDPERKLGIIFEEIQMHSFFSDQNSESSSSAKCKLGSNCIHLVSEGENVYEAFVRVMLKMVNI